MKQRTGVKVAQSVIWSPKTFYANLEPGTNYRFPLIYAAAAAMLGGVLLGGASLVFEVEILTEAFRDVSLRILVFGLLGYFIFLSHTLGTHVVAVVFGAHDFRRTVEAMAYPTILTLTFGWIPVINLVVGLYGLSLQVKGLMRLHKMSGFFAGASVVLGGVFGLIFVFVLASLIGALLVG